MNSTRFTSLKYRKNLNHCRDVKENYKDILDCSFTKISSFNKKERKS